MGFFDEATKFTGVGQLLGDDTLFGDKNAAADAQAAENAASREFFKTQVDEARREIDPLFGAAQQNRQLGSQGALDVLGGGLQSQLSAFQRGNVGAQNAILGGNFTPQALNFDTSFIPQNLPQTVTKQNIVEPNQARQVAGFGSDLDLFQAAAAGDIPGISQEDQSFFAQLAQDSITSGGGAGRGLLDNPADRSFVGLEGGLNAANEGKLANLLNQFQGIGGGAQPQQQQPPFDIQALLSGGNNQAIIDFLQTLR